MPLRQMPGQRLQRRVFEEHRRHQAQPERRIQPVRKIRQADRVEAELAQLRFRIHVFMLDLQRRTHVLDQELQHRAGEVARRFTRCRLHTARCRRGCRHAGLGGRGLRPQPLAQPRRLAFDHGDLGLHRGQCPVQRVQSLRRLHRHHAHARAHQPRRRRVHAHSAFRPQRPVDRHRPAGPLTALDLFLALARKRVQIPVRRRVVRLTRIPGPARQRREQHQEREIQPRRRRVQMLHTPHLGLQHLAPFLCRLLRQPAVAQYPRRMHDPVQTAVLRDDLLHLRRHGCAIAHVQRHVVHAGEFRQVRRLVRRQRRTTGQIHRRRRLPRHDLARQHQAQPTGPAGDQVHPVRLPRRQRRRCGPFAPLLRLQHTVRITQQARRAARRHVQLMRQLGSGDLAVHPDHLALHPRLFLVRRTQTRRQTLHPRVAADDLQQHRAVRCHQLAQHRQQRQRLRLVARRTTQRRTVHDTPVHTRRMRRQPVPCRRGDIQQQHHAPLRVLRHAILATRRPRRPQQQPLRRRHCHHGPRRQPAHTHHHRAARIGQVDIERLHPARAAITPPHPRLHRPHATPVDRHRLQRKRQRRTRAGSRRQAQHRLLRPVQQARLYPQRRLLGRVQRQLRQHFVHTAPHALHRAMRRTVVHAHRRIAGIQRVRRHRLAAALAQRFP